MEGSDFSVSGTGSLRKKDEYVSSLKEALRERDGFSVTFSANDRKTPEAQEKGPEEEGRREKFRFPGKTGLARQGESHQGNIQMALMVDRDDCSTGRRDIFQAFDLHLKIGLAENGKKCPHTPVEWPVPYGGRNFNQLGSFCRIHFTASSIVM